MSKSSSVLTLQSWPSEAVVLIGIAFVVHAAVLTWVYPGFYDPLWPHHSDFYIAPAFAHSHISLLRYFGMPRPVGTLFLAITGYLGTRGAIAANLALVFLNCTLTAMILRRVVAIRKTWTFLIAYCFYLFLLFSHPFQYVWSTYDVFAQLSYFFLASAVMLHLRGFGTLVLFCFFLCAFLAKETFGLSVLFLCALWWFGGNRSERRRAAVVGAAIVLALAISLVLNRMNQSPFLSSGVGSNSPYKIDFSLTSVATEWLRYAAEGMPLAIWAIVIASVLILAMLWKVIDLRVRILAIGLPIAGALAWLPNSVIPGHHYSGYSWNSSYLMFAPILFWGAIWIQGSWLRGIVFVLSASVLFTPSLFKASYSANGWILEQQQRQKRLLTDLQRALRQLPSGAQTVLVTGLNFPFSPFDHGLSLFSLGNLGTKRFTVVAYEPRTGSVPAYELLDAQPAPVEFVSPESVKQGQYDEVWMFRNNGSLFRVTDRKEAVPISTSLFTPLELMNFPEAAEALGYGMGTSGSSSIPDDGYRLLRCGASLVAYEQPRLALRCLAESISRIPENPYPYFYSGVALEQLHQTDDAKPYYEKAVAHDDIKAPNPAFMEAVRRLEN